MSDATTLPDRTGSPAVNRAAARAWLFPHPLAWAACWLMIFIEFVWISTTEMSFRFGAAWGLAIIASVLVIIGVANTENREKLAMTFLALAFFIIFGKQARVFNYLSVSAGFPLVDSSLHQIDTALGFDWLAVVTWVNQHPFIEGLMHDCYNALSYLTGFTLLALTLLGMFERLREFLLIFAITIIMTLLVDPVFRQLALMRSMSPARK